MGLLYEFDVARFSRQAVRIKLRQVIRYFSMQNLPKILHFLTNSHPFFVFEFRHPFLEEK